MKKNNALKIPAICIALILFIVPFFWLKPGEVDIGGDNSRLYFYDPQTYMASAALFSVDPQGTQQIVPNQNFLPMLYLLSWIRNISHSPDLPAILEKSIKISASFWFIYLLVYEMLFVYKKERVLLPKEIASLLAGLFYVFSPAVTENMRYALFTHNQVFLNPMVFYLLLRYFVTDKSFYLWWLLLVTVFFAPNFTLLAPPPLFSFYPIAFLFLFLYVKFILKKTILRKALLFSMIVGVGLHAFQILPVLSYVLDPGSMFHQRILEATPLVNPGLDYFNAILSLARVSSTLFLSTLNPLGKSGLVVFPFVLIVGLSMTNRFERNNGILLTGGFFFIALYFATAKITYIGVTIYRMFFFIPGFGMFRNFFGQFQFVYAFFYALIFGLTAGVVLVRLRNKYRIFFSLLLCIFLIYRGLPLLFGKTVNFKLEYAQNVWSPVRMDPRYEATLVFIRSLPPDGKILTLPLSDFYMQVLHGTNNGAYIGPSTISYLTDKSDFAAYHFFSPFSEVLMSLAREEKYRDIESLLGILNIRYIYFNSDPNIYDDIFYGYPYSFMRTSLPKTHTAYAKFISMLTNNQIYENGPYKIYELKKSAVVPLLSIPQTISIYKDDGKAWDTKDKVFFAKGKPLNSTNGYVTYEECLRIFPNENCKNSELTVSHVPHVTFAKVNLSKYKIKLEKNLHPFVLILSHEYNASWNLYLKKTQTKIDSALARIFNDFTQKIFKDPKVFETADFTSVAKSRHFVINGYANAWLILPTDLQDGINELVVETSAQQDFYRGAVVSSVSAIPFIIWGIKLLISTIQMI